MFYSESQSYFFIPYYLVNFRGSYNKLYFCVKNRGVYILPRKFYYFCLCVKNWKVNSLLLVIWVKDGIIYIITHAWFFWNVDAGNDRVVLTSSQSLLWTSHNHGLKILMKYLHRFYNTEKYKIFIHIEKHTYIPETLVTPK